MIGDARRRHCGRCERDVHDLSELTEDEARRVAKPGTCVRFAVDRVGRIRHLPAAAVGVMLATPALASGIPQDLPPSEGIVARVARAVTTWWRSETVTIEPRTVIMGAIAPDDAPPPSPHLELVLSPTIHLPTTLEMVCDGQVHHQTLDSARTPVSLAADETCTGRLGNNPVGFPLSAGTTVRCHSLDGDSCRVE
jgi:hypothetical protein